MSVIIVCGKGKKTSIGAFYRLRLWGHEHGMPALLLLLSKEISKLEVLLHRKLFWQSATRSETMGAYIIVHYTVTSLSKSYRKQIRSMENEILDCISLVFVHQLFYIDWYAFYLILFHLLANTTLWWNPVILFWIIHPVKYLLMVVHFHGGSLSWAQDLCWNLFEAKL